MNPPSEITLACLQEWMQSILVHPVQSAEDPPHTLLPAAFQAGAIEALICSSRRLSAREHLAIYQRSYLLRLCDCMAGQFPALKAALGDELFGDFASQYIQTHPSRSHTLSELGRRFADFLESTRPDRDAPQREAWPDFLIELARFEDAVAELFDRPEPAAGESMGTGIRASAMLRVFAHTFPTLAYYRAVMRGGETPPLPFPAPSFALIVRHHERLGLFDLQALQYRILCMLQAGSSLESALVQAKEEDEVSADHLECVWPRWVSAWLETGVLVSR